MSRVKVSLKTLPVEIDVDEEIKRVIKEKDKEIARLTALVARRDQTIEDLNNNARIVMEEKRKLSAFSQEVNTFKSAVMAFFDLMEWSNERA